MKPITKRKIRTALGTFEYAYSAKHPPSVVLINGGSGPIEGWYKVFHEMAEEFTVFAYNRLGVGGSDKPLSPQHGTAIVEALQQLLADAGVPSPYVLVGHSLGGLYANLFARRYPEETAGVVLLDASHPQDLALNASQPPFIRMINRLLGVLNKPSPWDEVRFVDQTARQIEQAGPFPDIPLYVISGMKKPPMMPASIMAIRAKHQLDLVALSPQGNHIPASRSGHFPQMSEPELVVQAVRECVKRTER